MVPRADIRRLCAGKCVCGAAERLSNTVPQKLPYGLALVPALEGSESLERFPAWVLVSFSSSMIDVDARFEFRLVRTGKEGSGSTILELSGKVGSCVTSLCSDTHRVSWAREDGASDRRSGDENSILVEGAAPSPLSLGASTIVAT